MKLPRAFSCRQTVNIRVTRVQTRTHRFVFPASSPEMTALDFLIFSLGLVFLHATTEGITMRIKAIASRVTQSVRTVRVLRLTAQVVGRAIFHSFWKTSV